MFYNKKSIQNFICEIACLNKKDKLLDLFSVKTVGIDWINNADFDKKLTYAKKYKI